MKIKSTIENAFGWRVGLLSLVMVFALFVASSCGGSLSPRNGGFPKKVSISAEGGTKVVKGTTDFILWAFADGMETRRVVSAMRKAV